MQCMKRRIMEASEEIRKLRESTGMNRKEFCEYFEIPYMTETDWELGNRRVPQYLLRLIEYKEVNILLNYCYYYDPIRLEYVKTDFKKMLQLEIDNPAEFI